MLRCGFLGWRFLDLSQSSTFTRPLGFFSDALSLHGAAGLLFCAYLRSLHERFGRFFAAHCCPLFPGVAVFSPPGWGPQATESSLSSSTPLLYSVLSSAQTSPSLPLSKDFLVRYRGTLPRFSQNLSSFSPVLSFFFLLVLTHMH